MNRKTFTTNVILAGSRIKIVAPTHCAVIAAASAILKREKRSRLTAVSALLQAGATRVEVS